MLTDARLVIRVSPGGAHAGVPRWRSAQSGDSGKALRLRRVDLDRGQ
jgi:hypothetical protein